jgi:imidazolonepropionase-like amidohydrolase
MAQAGLTPFQVLRTGTSNVGRYVRDVLKQDGDFGTIASGQRADLVLLEGNPLSDLDHLNRRAGVMVRGQWLDAAQLAQGLQEIARRNRE